jgi:hypothetical protein
VALHYIIALKDTEHQKLTGLEMEWKTSVAERHPMSCFEAIRHRYSMLGWWTFLEKPCLMPTLVRLLEGPGKYFSGKILMYDVNAYPDSTLQIPVVFVEIVKYGTYMSAHKFSPLKWYQRVLKK